MKKIVGSLLLCGLLFQLPLLAGELSTLEPLQPGSSESIAFAKKTALEIADTFISKEFRARDAVWDISLTPKKPLLLQVTLFSGNQYWFAVAASAPATALKIAIYDAGGHPLKMDLWKDRDTSSGVKIAGGLVAPHSGKYFVKLELTDSQRGSKGDACLVYAYK